jgi:hypothetical protein
VGFSMNLPVSLPKLGFEDPSSVRLETTFSKPIANCYVHLRVYLYYSDVRGSTEVCALTD